ncbi:MAG: sigma-54 dependent transcriptional regulator [Anaerolineaceae bacterium]|jgi:DNA-binding NtrC family response regulator|nr:sigma-54 dependent transcriptional regulator [Anaerolineaceae bacterium]MDP3721419.1 sigma-54 dependent transcriptional regulator [Anaerolineaceae bacterium]
MSFCVLIVDDEESARQNIGEFLKGKGHEIIEAGTLTEARERVKRGEGDVILLDVQLPDGYGPTLIMETAMLAVRPPIIVITGFGDIETAVDAMKNGALDFLTKPLDFVQLDKSLAKALEIVAMRREIAHYREQQMKNSNFVIGQTPLMKIVVEQALKAADAQVSVMITGENGTGKDVLAQYIHANGPRASKPFIAINCAAIQHTVLESELFGHEAGAFSSADRKKLGLMEVADNGILFMDEISSMPLEIQAKLLRAIETHSFMRVGGTQLISVDIQVVVASNRDLQAMVKEGSFRQDLYYRLKKIDLDLPPLRERKVDIPEMVGYFIRQNNGRQGANITGVSPQAMEALLKYDWPGNIRELANAIERALIFCDGETIALGDLPRDILNPR